jgi:hypothetical protein
MDFAAFLLRVEQWTRGQPATEVIPFIEELFTRYLAACEDERQAIRQAVRANRELWNIVGDDDISMYLGHLATDPVTDVLQCLRGWLIAVSMTGGCADWRDTILVLTDLREKAEAQGIATRFHFTQIAATAEGGNTHGISGMSTRELMWSAGALIWFEGELRERAAVLGMLEARQRETTRSSEALPATHESVSQPKRPWWRIGKQ